MRTILHILILTLLSLILTGTYLWYTERINLAQTVEYSVQTANVVEATEIKESVDAIEATMRSLTLEEKIGQLFVVGHWDTKSASGTKTLIEQYHLGGVIIMRVPEEDESDLIAWKQTWEASSTIPLLIAIDQEGGVVSRLKSSEYIQTPQRDITSVDEALTLGRKRGEELQKLGINTNFAPVLEQSENPSAFLYSRTFNSSTSVALYGKAMIEGMRQSGVIAVPKHYPGHEDTVADSHKVLPVLSVESADFTRHTKSFDNVIKYNNPYAMMTAHVLVPGLDPKYPATLSQKILTGALRHEAGFAGVIITDDMTMGAITNHYDVGDATVRALKAGADIILFAADPEEVETAIAAVQTAIKNNELTETRLNQSIERILEMKEEY